MPKMKHTFDAWVVNEESVVLGKPKAAAGQFSFSLEDPGVREVTGGCDFDYSRWATSDRDSVEICFHALLRILGLDDFEFMEGDKMKLRVTVEYNPDKVETIVREEEE